MRRQGSQATLTTALTATTQLAERILETAQTQLADLSRQDDGSAHMESTALAALAVTIPTLEFMRRWCLHVQSEQLTKTRYFGGWCCHKRAEYQATCRRLLGIDPSESVDEEVEPEELEPQEVQSFPSLGTPSEQSETPELQCAACGSYKLLFIGETPKPAWSDLLTHEDERCPAWYAETEYQSFCEYLEREYGISYSDWSLEMREESTMSEPLQTELPATESSQPPPIPQLNHPRQLYLPGLLPETSYYAGSH